MEHKKNRRKTNTRNPLGADGVGRSDRLAKRNKALVARWYFWTECKRLRTDDALQKLCDEFYLDDRRIYVLLLENDAYFRELLANKTTCKDLKRVYNSFNWTDGI